MLKKIFFFFSVIILILGTIYFALVLRILNPHYTEIELFLQWCKQWYISIPTFICSLFVYLNYNKILRGEKKE